MRVKLLALLLLLIPTLIPTLSYAETCVLFFWGQGCPACASVQPYINEITLKYNITLINYEIYNNRSNLLLLNKFFDRYNIPQNRRGIPTVLISDKILIGVYSIRDHLEEEIILCQQKECSCEKLYGIENKTVVHKNNSSISSLEPDVPSIWVITGAALVDSVNPCAIAVLLILLTTLLAAGTRRKAFFAGISFTTSIYISYFLFGLGIFTTLQITGISALFYKIVGLIAIIVGVLNLKDYLRYGAGGFVIEIPRSWRPTLKKLLKTATSPLGAFLIGFAVCLFELPCTGGPYLFILGLLAGRTPQTIAIPLLLYYNFFFVLPLLILNFLIYLGLSTIEKSKEWKDRNIKKMHLFAGIVMIVLGILVMFNLV